MRLGLRARVWGNHCVRRTHRRLKVQSESVHRDDLRPEYEFDCSKAVPDRYAARLKGKVVAVFLDPDVAQVFRTSDSVNELLRSVISALPRQARLKKWRERAAS